jgi:hypothetical protein
LDNTAKSGLISCSGIGAIGLHVVQVGYYERKNSLQLFEGLGRVILQGSTAEVDKTFSDLGADFD